MPSAQIDFRSNFFGEKSASYGPGNTVDGSFDSKVKMKIKEEMEYHEEKFARLQKEYERFEHELAREQKTTG